MPKFKVIQFKDDCISCGACAAIAPDFWEMDEQGIAHLKESVKVGEQWEKIITSEDARAQNQEAADACPVQIIKIKDEKAQK